MAARPTNPYALAALTILASHADDPRIEQCVTDDRIDWGCLLAPSAGWTVGERAALEGAANIEDGSTYQRVDLGSLAVNASDADYAAFKHALDGLRAVTRTPEPEPDAEPALEVTADV